MTGGAAHREAPSPRVCVLLLNWRGWEDTIECLESVFRQGYPEFQVVVCDNDSGDGSLERIAEWACGRLEVSGTSAHLRTTPVPKPVELVVLDREEAEAGGGARADVPLVLIRTGGNLGFAGGNNVGLRFALARGDFTHVWLLNNDTVIDATALTELVRIATSRGRIGMVGSTLRYYDDPERVQALGGGRVTRWNGTTHHYDESFIGSAATTEPDYITGASLLVSMEVVKAIGGMDERYFLYSEEVDWCLRAREKGWRLAYAPDSIVWHKAGRSVGYRTALHDYHTTRGMLLLVRRFYPTLLPLAVGYSLYRCLGPKIVRRQGTRFRAVMRAYTDLLLRRPAAYIPQGAAPPGPSSTPAGLAQG